MLRALPGQGLKIKKNGESSDFLSSVLCLISLLSCSNICLPYVVEIFSCCNACLFLLALSLMISNRRVALCCFYPPIYVCIQQLKPCSFPVQTLIFPALSAPLAAVPWQFCGPLPDLPQYVYVLLDRLVHGPECNRPSLLQEHTKIQIQIVYPQILFIKATFQLGSDQLVLLHEPQPVPEQDSTFASVELHLVSVSPFLQLFMVS